eukprot:UN18734
MKRQLCSAGTHQTMTRSQKAVSGFVICGHGLPNTRILRFRFLKTKVVPGSKKPKSFQVPKGKKGVPGFQNQSRSKFQKRRRAFQVKAAFTWNAFLLFWNLP